MPDELEKLLCRHTPFDRMSSKALQLIFDNSTLNSYAKDEFILQPTQSAVEHLYILISGQIIGVNQSSDDILWELYPGEIFPIGALLGDRPVTHHYQAKDQCQCLLIEKNIFKQLMHASPEFADFCSRRLAHLLDINLDQQQNSRARELVSQGNINTRLHEIIGHSIHCDADTTIQEALIQLQTSQRRSIAIVDQHNHPIGILTLRDVLERIVLPQADIGRSVSEVMSPTPVTLNQDNFGYEAALAMTEQGIGHVCVVDDRQQFLGIVSERDLFSLQHQGLASISRALQHANSIETLARLQNDIRQLILQMQAQGIGVEQLTAIITRLNDHTTVRIIELCQNEFPEIRTPFSWLAFGSEGRMEQTLVTDQDNGILFYADSDNDAETIRKQLIPLARRINEALDQCGFPLCKGNIMASNPECCLSLDEWQTRFKHWVTQGTPEHLLKASIFFDFRVIYGDTEISKQLHNYLLHMCQQQTRFQMMMAANALQNQPPLGLFGDFKTRHQSDGSQTIDLKINGITPIVDVARIYALAHGINETNTLKRLDALAETNRINAVDIQNWKQAWHFIQLLRMQNHLHHMKINKTANNSIDPGKLNDLEQRILKESFRQVRKLQKRLAMDYQG